MTDARSEIGKSLESKMSQENIDLLLDEILKSTKQAWAACPSCKKRSLFEIPDATAVTGSLIKLADQAWGRPDVASSGDEERIVFERVVWMTDEPVAAGSS